MRRNIHVLYVVRVLRTFFLFIAVFLPFFAQYDLSQTEFFLTQSTFAVTIVALEVPSGFLADRNGRRLALLIGSGLVAGGFWGYALGDSIVVFIVCELLLGIGYSFISGADEALAYDSYRALGETDQYKKFEANSNSYVAIGEAVASISGGFLAILSLRAPFIGQAIIGSAMFPLCLLLVEPTRPKRSTNNAAAPTIRAVTKMALYENHQLRWLVAYGAVISTTTHTAVWLIQPYYELVNIPIGWFGVAWAAQSVAQGFFSRTTLSYERLLGLRNVLISLPIIGVITYITLGAFPSIFVLPAILGFVFIRAVQVPLLRQAMNDLVESDYRATVLSVSNMAKFLLYAGLGPLIGFVVDVYSLQVALLASAVIYGVLGAVLLAVMTIGRNVDSLANPTPR